MVYVTQPAGRLRRRGFRSHVAGGREGVAYLGRVDVGSVGLRLRLGNDGQFDVDDRAPLGRADNRHGSAVVRNDLADDGQSEA